MIIFEKKQLYEDFFKITWQTDKVEFSRKLAEQASSDRKTNGKYI
jgi:hypothetical protein